MDKVIQGFKTTRRAQSWQMQSETALSSSTSVEEHVPQQSYLPTSTLFLQPGGSPISLVSSFWMSAVLCLLGNFTEESHDETRGDPWKGETWIPNLLILPTTLTQCVNVQARLHFKQLCSFLAVSPRVSQQTGVSQNLLPLSHDTSIKICQLFRPIKKFDLFPPNVQNCVGSLTHALPSSISKSLLPYLAAFPTTNCQIILPSQVAHQVSG